MKSLKFLSLMMLFGLIAFNVEAQTTTKPKTTTTSKPKTTTTKKPTTPPAKKDITITLQSLSEKNVSVFSGPKENLRDPKLNQLRTVGGLSKNTLYLKTYDVVCIMGANNKTVACAEIKPGTTVVEINSSATVVTRK